jgi:hypothetical protein
VDRIAEGVILRGFLRLVGEFRHGMERLSAWRCYADIHKSV